MTDTVPYRVLYENRGVEQMNSTDHTESSGESEQKRNAYSAYRKNLNERHSVSGLQGLRMPHRTKNELRCTVPPLIVGQDVFINETGC